MISLIPNTDSEEDSPKKVISNAIESIGGRDQLGAYKAISWSEHGEYRGLESRVTYQGDYAVQFPDRYRMRVKGAFTIVVDKDRGWINSHGLVEVLTDEQMREYREANHVIWAMQLYPLLEDDRFQIRHLYPFESVDKESWGIRVSSPGYRDVDLYFDKTLFLLSKSIRRGFVPEYGHEEIEMETIYEEHERTEGILFPTKMVMLYNGNQVLKAKTGEYQLHTEVDEALFSRPA